MLFYRIFASILPFLLLAASPIQCEWSKWTDCNNSCDTGIVSQFRQSKNSSLSQYRSCPSDDKACTHNVNARDKLCATLNNQFGVDSWISSKYSLEDCSLTCVSSDKKFVIRPHNINTDGIPCTTANGTDNGICLQKYCAPIGCDGILGSDAKLDKCFQCLPYREKGMSSLCKKFTISFASLLDIPVINVLIPAQAASITLSYANKITLLTATSLIQFHNESIESSVRSIAGTLFTFKNETLYADGPLLDNITIKIESSGNGHHPQLSLEYYQLSREEETNNNKSLDYSWVYGEFSDCSVTCGSGVQVSHAHCQDAEFPEKVLPENFCNKSSKPYPIVIKCSRPLCLPRWKVSEWSLCTAICGGGSQERLVECVQIDDQEIENILLPESCDQATRPPQHRECNTHSCGKWKISKWSNCNPSCGEGMKHRLVQCIDDDQNIIDKVNCPLPVPSRSIPCFNGLCHFTWQAGSWEQCSSSCGTGTQNRLVTCATHSGEVVNSSKCPNSTKPLDARECFSSENCAKQWISKPWGQCEGPCGFTHQYRNVSCYGIVNGEMYLLPEASCDSLKKPPTERSCNKTGCPYWQTSSWSFCSTTCGEGQQTRTVQCVKSDGQITTGCHINTKPPEVTSCSLKPCTACQPSKPEYDCETMVKDYGCGYPVIQLLCCETCANI